MKKMKIILDLIENKNPLTLRSLDIKILKHLFEDQGLFPMIDENYFFSKKGEPGMFGCREAVLIVKEMPPNISQLYQTITNAGYSIKGSTIIREDGISTDSQRLANNYFDIKARFNPKKTWGMIVSKDNPKLTNLEVGK